MKEQEVKFAPVDKNDSRKLAKQKEAEEKELKIKQDKKEEDKLLR